MGWINWMAWGCLTLAVLALIGDARMAIHRRKLNSVAAARRRYQANYWREVRDRTWRDDDNHHLF
jgi:hypothetical protein